MKKEDVTLFIQRLDKCLEKYIEKGGKILSIEDGEKLTKEVNDNNEELKDKDDSEK